MLSKLKKSYNIGVLENSPRYKYSRHSYITKPQNEHKRKPSFGSITPLNKVYNKRSLKERKINKYNNSSEKSCALVGKEVQKPLQTEIQILKQENVQVSFDDRFLKQQIDELKDQFKLQIERQKQNSELVNKEPKIKTQKQRINKVRTLNIDLSKHQNIEKEEIPPEIIEEQQKSYSISIERRPPSKIISSFANSPIQASYDDFMSKEEIKQVIGVDHSRNDEHKSGLERINSFLTNTFSTVENLKDEINVIKTFNQEQGTQKKTGKLKEIKIPPNENLIVNKHLQRFYRCIKQEFSEIRGLINNENHENPYRQNLKQLNLLVENLREEVNQKPEGKIVELIDQLKQFVEEEIQRYQSPPKQILSNFSKPIEQNSYSPSGQSNDVSNQMRRSLLNNFLLSFVEEEDRKQHQPFQDNSYVTKQASFSFKQETPFEVSSIIQMQEQRQESFLSTMNLDANPKVIQFGSFRNAEQNSRGLEEDDNFRDEIKISVNLGKDCSIVSRSNSLSPIVEHLIPLNTLQLKTKDFQIK